VTIRDRERALLESQNGLPRFCVTCGQSTRWAPAIAGTLWEPLAAHDPSQFEEHEDVGPSVLLIDDDESILQVLGKALKIAHCDVVAVNSARDAAMLLARGEFDVIVSDICMPEFNGMQLFEFMDKHFPEHKDHVIFVTGDSSPQTMQFLEDHHARFLTKPFDIHPLLAMVKDSTPHTHSAA
jgi:CheY-like chemotaxis protein